MSAAGERLAALESSWVGRVWNHVDTIAARNGHDLDWVTEGLKSHPTGQWITARCKNCSPPSSGNYLSLPLDDHRTEAPDWWHEGVIPSYLKRKCRQTREPRPGPSGRKGVTRAGLAALAIVAVAGIVAGCSASAPRPASAAVVHPVASVSPSTSAGTAAVPCSQFLPDLRHLYKADRQQNGGGLPARNFPITDLMTPANDMDALFGAVGYEFPGSLAGDEAGFYLDSGYQSNAGYLAYGILTSALGADISNLAADCGVGGV